MRKKPIYLGIFSYCLTAGAAIAAAHPVTLAFVGGITSFSVDSQGSANYAVCRDARVPSGNLPLYFNDIGGGNYANQITTGASTCAGVPSVCSAPFSLSSGSCCCLKLSLNDSGNLSVGTYSLVAEVGVQPHPKNPVYGGQAQPLAINVSSIPSRTTLSVNPTTLPLALSVKDTNKNTALTGKARTLTVTNTGVSSANITTISSSDLPKGTTIASSCANTKLPAGGSCTVTITPGSNASSDCTTGIAPTLSTVTVNASNAPTVTASFVVLGYGCVHQGGLIYSVDDTTPNTSSIGGKVVSLVDQAEPYITRAQSTSIIWSSNGSGGSSNNISYDIIPGIDDSSTSGYGSPTYIAAQTAYNSNYYNVSIYPFPATDSFASCDGSTDGACNSRNILGLHNTYNTNYGVDFVSPGKTDPTFYAAGLCTATINGYSDWYLPAICEMDAVHSNVTCQTNTQNMVGSLNFLVGNPAATTPSTSCSSPNGVNCLVGYYWSSTEGSSPYPQYYAWNEYFSTAGSNQNNKLKGKQLGVRCARAF